MSDKFEDINIKNHTHYFFDNVINNIKIDEKSYKNILFYFSGY